MIYTIYLLFQTILKATLIRIQYYFQWEPQSLLLFERGLRRILNVKQRKLILDTEAE